MQSLNSSISPAKQVDNFGADPDSAIAQKPNEMADRGLVETIAQANPGAAYRALKDQIDGAVARVLNSGYYILGPEVAGFESEFARWQGSRTALGCANGTDALALILRGLGIGAGSAVATVSHTAVATVAAIEMAGAVPALVDIEPDYFTMDPADLLALLENPPVGLPPIRAVIPVHLYGQAADLDSILAICARFSVAIIEDCSQAHGALYNGRKVGSFGRAAAFSLYPTKNLGALGDAGVIATDDDALAARIAALRQYGWRKRLVSEAIGVNSRLDEIQAAILRVRLRHLDEQNARRGIIARRYDAALGDGPLRPPARRPVAEHVFHQYVLRPRDRDSFQRCLKSLGIGTGIHYPAPVHLQPAYLGRTALAPSACRITEDAARQVLSLPVYPELTDEQVARIGAALRTTA
jgi:dTDP-4-amino-4,6-dideoxygalactose transaminase